MKILCLSILFIVSILSLQGCQRLTSDEQETCLKYKFTISVIKEYTIKFYPKSKIGLDLKTNSTNLVFHSSSIEKHLILDGWDNPFGFIEEESIVYSWGKNGADELGKGDDISFIKASNKSFYCND